MKKRILTIASILFLAIMIPLTVNAATISAEPKEMKVGDIATVTVEIETADTESVQFDLAFDNTKYKYVLNSATSELDSTGSNLLNDNTVRVVAFQFNNNNPVQTVKLQFEAIASGKSVPFEVVDGSLEATNSTGTTTLETFAEPTVLIAKIEPNPDKNVKDPQYYDKDGNPITQHKPTGATTRATAKKSIAGVYTKLITGKKVVPYALPTSDDVLTVKDIKAEFENADVTSLTNPIKSGDIFTINGENHIVLIYGDVNKDGKVTAADALITRKYELNTLIPDEVTAITHEVGDTMDDSKAIQQFALRLRTTTTKTILEKYPVEFVASDFNFSYNTSIYRGEKSLIATISLKDSRTITSDILSAINVPNATVEVKDTNGTIEIYATPNNSNSFSIAPTLTNNNLENGKITEQPTTITVEEVKTVTDIELFDKAGNKVSNTYSLISGEMPILTIKYYHTYPDGSKTELNDTNMNDILLLNTNRVKISTPTVLKKALLLDNDEKDPQLNFINKLKLESSLDNLGTDNLTITITNSSKYSSTQNYHPTLTIPLTVEVTNEKITGIKINGKAVNPNDEVEINIYSAGPADYHLNRNNKDFYFTALQIDLVTNTGKTRKTTPIMVVDYYDEDSVKDPNSLTICQTGPTKEDSEELRVVSLYRNSTTNEYKEQTDAYSEADAIGISYQDSYDNDISALSQGLELYYGGQYKITIKVNAIDNRVTNSPSSPADSNLNTFNPPGIDSEENLSTNTRATEENEDEEEKEKEEVVVDVTSSPAVSESPNVIESANPNTDSEVTTTPESIITPEVTPSQEPVSEINE